MSQRNAKTAAKAAEKPAGKPTGRSAFEILYPSEHVEIDTGTAKLGWKVFPVRVEDMKKFSNAIGRAMQALGAVQVAHGATMEEHAKRMLPAMISIILTDLLDLVEVCCKPDADNIVEIKVMELPHWHVVPIVKAWIRESFIGEEKLRPLVEAAESMMEELTGERPDLWGMFSKFSSGLGTDSPTSSIEDSPASPIEDGASPNSSST